MSANTNDASASSHAARQAAQIGTGNRGTSAPIFGDSFDGSTTVDAFLVRFERHCAHYGVTEAQKVNMLPLCLRGYVEVWFNNLVADPANSEWISQWSEWKEWLLKEFGKQDTEDDLIDALRACEPTEGEHILDFNFRFKVCASAVPSSVLSDKLKISQYLEAVKLLNEEAVTYCKLQDQGPKTLKNTMDNAVKYFKASGLDSSSGSLSVARRGLQARQDREKTPSPTDREKSQASTIEELTRQVQNLTLIVERETSACRRCGRRGHTQDYCRAPECRLCNKVGHTEERCFSNPNNSQRLSPRTAPRQQVDQRRVSFDETRTSHPNAAPVRILPRPPANESPSPHPVPTSSGMVPPTTPPNLGRESGGSTQLFVQPESETIRKEPRETEVECFVKRPREDFETSAQAEAQEAERSRAPDVSAAPTPVNAAKPPSAKKSATVKVKRTKKSVPKKKSGSSAVSKAADQEMAGRFLNAPAPITCGELFKYKPSLARDVARVFQVATKPKTSRVTSTHLVKAEGIKPATYIYQVRGEVQGKECAVYCDNCSYYSIINSELCERLNIPVVSSKNKAYITSATNDSLGLGRTAEVSVKFGSREAPIQFWVQDNSPFDILIGLDVLEVLSFEYSLKTMTANFTVHDEVVQLPLEIFRRKASRKISESAEPQQLDSDAEEDSSIEEEEDFEDSEVSFWAANHRRRPGDDDYESDSTHSSMPSLLSASSSDTDYTIESDDSREDDTSEDSYNSMPGLLQPASSTGSDSSDSEKDTDDEDSVKPWNNLPEFITFDTNEGLQSDPRDEIEDEDFTLSGGFFLVEPLMPLSWEPGNENAGPSGTHGASSESETEFPTFSIDQTWRLDEHDPNPQPEGLSEAGPSNADSSRPPSTNEEEFRSKIWSNQHLTEDQKESLYRLIKEHAHLFVTTESIDPTAGTIDLVEHEIDTGDNPPVFSRPFRETRPETATLRREIDELLRVGAIEPSASPWASPVLLVPKKDETWRFCIDYRKLNRATKKDKWPLPLIEALLHEFAGAKVFSSFDMYKGYYQLRVAEKDRDKTSFIVSFGTFRWRVMPMGLTNAPATFARLINQIFHEYIGEFIAAYLDDLNVFSKTFEEHLSHLKRFFVLCDRNNLKLKWSKSQIAEPEIYFVGYQVNAEGIQPNPKKKEALEKLKPPSNVKELRSFLGLGNYFRRFIKNYSALVRPLTLLTKKDQSFVWSEECHKAFLEVKHRLTTAPVLAHFDPARDTSVSTDASKYALGAVLEQLVEGTTRPVAFFSARLSDAEINYTTMEKEALGVVRALLNWRIELAGVEFTVYTDNSAVASVLSMRDLNGRIARWVHKLSEFTFTLKHRSGKINVVADFLSRIQVPTTEEVGSSSTCVLASVPEPAAGDISQEDLAPPYSDESLVMFRLAMQTDSASAADGILKEFRQKYPSMWKRKNEFLLLNGELMKHHKGMLLRVLYPSEFESYLFSLHNVMGHFGFQTLWNFLSCRVWHPMLRREAMSHVRACVSCQQFDLRRGDHRFNRPMSCPSLFAVIAIDYAGPFPDDEGDKYVLLAVLTSIGYPFARAFPAADSACAARFLLEDIMPVIGAPEEILSDRGTHFENRLLHELSVRIGSRQKFVPPKISRWNPKAERFIGTFQAALNKMVFEFERPNAKWKKFVSSVLFSYRVRQKIDGKSPFFLLYGQEPRLPLDDRSPPRDSGQELFPSEELPVQVRAVELDVLRGYRYMLSQLPLAPPESERGSTIYHAQDLVWMLDGRVLQSMKFPRFQPRWLGPFQVIEKISRYEYRLQDNSGEVLPNPVHVYRLKPFCV